MRESKAVRLANARKACSDARLELEIAKIDVADAIEVMVKVEEATIAAEEAGSEHARADAEKSLSDEEKKLYGEVLLQIVRHGDEEMRNQGIDTSDHVPPGFGKPR